MKKYIFGIIYSSILLGATIVLFEIILRCIYREEEINGNYWGLAAFQYDEILGYRHASGFKGFAYREGVFNCFVEISQYNLRQANIDEQLQFSRRVLILGDSFAFGLGVKEENGFANLLQKRLNSKGIGIINGSQTGYSPKQEVEFGMSLVPIVKPEVIILCLFLTNDIEGDYYEDYKNIEVKWGYRLSKQRRLPIEPFDFFRTHSYAWMLLKKEIAKREKLIEKKSFRFQNLMETVPLDEIIQPTLEALRTLSWYSFSLNIKLGIVMIPESGGETTFNTAIKFAFEKDKIHVLDLHEMDFSVKDYFQRDGHWNEYGHQKAANYIGPFIEELVLTPK